VYNYTIKPCKEDVVNWRLRSEGKSQRENISGPSRDLNPEPSEF
jgi:hypothetical protein